MNNNNINAVQITKDDLDEDYIKNQDICNQHIVNRHPAHDP